MRQKAITWANVNRTRCRPIALHNHYELITFTPVFSITVFKNEILPGCWLLSPKVIRVFCWGIPCVITSGCPSYLNDVDGEAVDCDSSHDRVLGNPLHQVIIYPAKVCPIYIVVCQELDEQMSFIMWDCSEHIKVWTKCDAINIEKLFRQMREKFPTGALLLADIGRGQDMDE